MRDTEDALYEFKKHWGRLIDNTPESETINLTKDQARCIYMFVDAFEPTWVNVKEDIESNPDFEKEIVDIYEDINGRKEDWWGTPVTTESLIDAINEAHEPFNDYYSECSIAYGYNERKAKELYKFREKTGWVRYRQGIKKYGEKNEWE